MNNRRFSHIPLVLMFLGWVFAPTLDCQSAPLGIVIYQYPNSVGDLRYDLLIPSISVFQNQGTVVAPNGRVFDNFFKSQFGSRAFDLSFAELQELVIGDWTIFDRFSLPFEPVQITPSEQHKFSISSIELTDLFTATPLIISPAASSVVPRTFDVRWQWPMGSVPPSDATWRVGGAGGGVEVVELGPSSYRFTIEFEQGESTDKISVSVGSRESLDRFISAINPVSMTASRRFEPMLDFSSLSAPLPLTVVSVPEPTFFSLATLLGGCLVVLRICINSVPKLAIARDFRAEAGK